MPTIDRNGRALNFELTGPDGPAIVFLNSLGTSLAMWDNQVRALEDRYRIIRLDWPGHGGSTEPAGISPVVDVLVEDALAVLDAAGVHGVHVVGLSLGGLVAQALALARPERVLSLTLCATSAGFGPPEMWTGRAATVRKDGMEPMVAASRPRWFTVDYPDREPAEAERMFDVLRAVRPEGYAWCCEVLRDTDLRSRLPALTVPLQLIAGAEDAATPPAKLEEIGTLVGHGDLTVLEGAAHILNVEQADRTTALIENFIAGGR